MLVCTVSLTKARVCLRNIQSMGKSKLQIANFVGNNKCLAKISCPAYGQTCAKCHGRNHFVVKCPNQKERNSKTKNKLVKRKHTKSTKSRKAHAVQGEYSTSENDDESTSQSDY